MLIMSLRIVKNLIAILLVFFIVQRIIASEILLSNSEVGLLLPLYCVFITALNKIQVSSEVRHSKPDRLNRNRRLISYVFM